MLTTTVLRSGDLVEAEADGQQCMRAVDVSQMNIARPFIGPYMAQVLIEQGRLAEAEATLAWVGLPDPLPGNGPFWNHAMAQSKLLLAQGHADRALSAATTAGALVTRMEATNPAFVPWRSQVAQCLHGLGRHADARQRSWEEVELARVCNFPRTLGHALRIAATVGGREDRHDLLTEAVTILENSAAKLEYAKALHALGTVQLRQGQRIDARNTLNQALDIAYHCNATATVQEIETELRHAGGQPRRRVTTGVKALTSSEYRVAGLAAAGLTNREIAQQLFITTKTVEVHLSNIYRKLNISKRHFLGEHLKSSDEPPGTAAQPRGH